jgi:hypothetical protein
LVSGFATWTWIWRGLACSALAGERQQLPGDLLGLAAGVLDEDQDLSHVE